MQYFDNVNYTEKELEDFRNADGFIDLDKMNVKISDDSREKMGDPGREKIGYLLWERRLYIKNN